MIASNITKNKLAKTLFVSLLIIIKNNCHSYERIKIEHLRIISRNRWHNKSDVNEDRKCCIQTINRSNCILIIEENEKPKKMKIAR